MILWNFFHQTLGLHIYVSLMFIVFVAILVIGIVHAKKHEQREKANLEKLSGLSIESGSLTETKGKEQE